MSKTDPVEEFVGRVSDTVQRAVDGQKDLERRSRMMNPNANIEADEAWKRHVQVFLDKKKELPALHQVDLKRLREERIRKVARVLRAKGVEPYYAATSIGLGTPAAKANSLEALLAFFHKIKEGQS